MCEAVTANSGRDRTTSWVYSVGWTHHTVGVQYIRGSAIIQLLLGNMGRPGGGILALRGHASIQGSTDIPTLFNLLPGYLPMPKAGEHDTLDDYIDSIASTDRRASGAAADAYAVSLLKSYWGDAATAENDYGFDYLPRLTGDHGTYQTVMDMLDDKVEGYLLFGQNPAVGSAHGKMQRLAMAHLKWLVVRDLNLIESATFWKDAPEIETGELRTEDIGTEVFFFPAASHVEKDGSFTQTQRMLQWHHKAVEPPGDSRSELHFFFHLGRKIRERLAGSTLERDRPMLDLAWDYPVDETGDPSAEAVLQEINGFHLTGDKAGQPLSSYTEMKTDGSTTGGCWIYTGVYADGVNQAARRKPGPGAVLGGAGVGLGLAGEPAHALQPRLGRPRGQAVERAQGLRVVGRGAGPSGPATTSRTSRSTSPRRTGRRGGRGRPGGPGRRRPVHHAGRRQGLALRADRAAGRAAARALRAAGVAGAPTRSTASRPTRPARCSGAPTTYSNPSRGEPGAEVFPYVFTTYRLTEHHTAGGMSRWLPYLSELQPEFFCEVSPELARERGLEHGGWATIVTRPDRDRGPGAGDRPRRPAAPSGAGRIHQVGLPYHWGVGGAALVTGDSANDLFGVTLDPNVHIQESKVASCDIRPGRRPTGPGVRRLVEDYCARAGITVDTGNAQRTPPRQARPHPRRRASMSIPWSGSSDPAPDAGWQDPPPRKGFFTDTSICIGCKACEVACKEWNGVPEDGFDMLGSSYDNTGALGASTWRHVAFIEQPKPLGRQQSGVGRPTVDLGMPSFAPPAARRPIGPRPAASRATAAADRSASGPTSAG